MIVSHQRVAESSSFFQISAWWQVPRGTEQCVTPLTQPLTCSLHVNTSHSLLTAITTVGAWMSDCIPQVKLWDTRQQSAAASLQLPDRVHCMDAKGPAMVVGTADRKITVFDLTPGNTSMHPNRACLEATACSVRCSLLFALYNASWRSGTHEIVPIGRNLESLGQIESPLLYQTRSLSIFHDL